MEVCRKESGEPFVILHGNGKKLFEERGAKNLLISLSHTEIHATAMAILEA
jgi:phosphopantetheinyl transferase (holo-ACP synthase)